MALPGIQFLYQYIFVDISVMLLTIVVKECSLERKYDRTRLGNPKYEVQK